MFAIIENCETDEIAGNILTYYGLRHTAKVTLLKIKSGETPEEALEAISAIELRRFKKANILFKLLKLLTGA